MFLPCVPAFFLVLFFYCWCSVARIVAVGDMGAWGGGEQGTGGWNTPTENVLSSISTVHNAKKVDVVAIPGDLSCKLPQCYFHLCYMRLGI